MTFCIGISIWPWGAFWPETSRNFSIPPLLQVCSTLLCQRMFYKCSWRLNWGTQVYGIKDYSSRFSCHQTDFHCSWLNKVKMDFVQYCWISKCIGAIDGTHIRIQAPSSYEQLFVNRKGYHSINVQVICYAKLRVLNCVGCWPGPTHDSRMLVNSKIHDAFERGEMQGVLWLHGARWLWLSTKTLASQTLLEPSQCTSNAVQHSPCHNKECFWKVFESWNFIYEI